MEGPRDQLSTIKPIGPAAARVAAPGRAPGAGRSSDDQPELRLSPVELRRLTLPENDSNAENSMSLDPLKPSNLPLTDGAESVPEGTISAERLREVARKVEQDFYDTPEVRDAVARRALRDLGSLGQE